MILQGFSGFFFFDEKDPTISIRTHNTDLKNRLTVPYREERRRAASEAAKKYGVHRKITHLYGDSN